ncbi:McrC family protein [Neoroseomonas oryzicola]|uniref:McrC family protein n=1 Tax=Neoroseomonas oryzicola TaxID=535904 RepID=UPI0030B9B9F4
MVRVQEHGRLIVGRGGLTEAELEFLLGLRQRGPYFFAEERVQGNWYCRFGGYAGAIAMPGGRTLEVLPKVGDLDDPASRSLLVRMLAGAEIGPSIEDAAADYGDSPTLIEAYLRFAADLALREVRLGLVHAYRRLDRRTPVVRGQLLIAKQLALLPERLDVHIARVEDYRADTPVNRSIKAGVRWIARVTRVAATAAKAREVVMRMDAVSDSTGPLRVLGDALRRLQGSIERDRRHRRLAPLLRVLGLLLDGTAVAPEAGAAAPGPTLMFDMSKVFEALLAARLRRTLSGCSVDEQASHRFDIAGEFMLRPDLLVRQGGKPALVLDAKWKRVSGPADVDDADLRQVFAYARILGLTDAALVYPKLNGAGAPLQHVQVADESGVRIHLWQVTVTAAGWNELDSDLGRLGSKAGLSPALR